MMTQPLSGRVVHRGYVNPWECDEMGHMNLQFHAAKFSDALVHLAGMAGVAPPRLHHLHFRFSHEMRASDLVSIRVSALTQDRARVALQFLLANGDELLASSQIAEIVCADSAQAGAIAAIAGMGEPHPSAMLRSIETAAFDAGASPAPRFESGRGVASPHECGPDGSYSARGTMARISECQAQMWQEAGIGRHWQVQENLATASVELGMRFHGTLKAGEPFFITTSFHPAGSKVMRFSHRLFHALTGQGLMEAEGAAVLIDRTTRRAVPLPAAARPSPRQSP